MGRDRTRKRPAVPDSTAPGVVLDDGVMEYLVGYLKDRYVVHKQLLQLRLTGHGTYQIRGRQRTVFDQRGTWEQAARFFVGHKLNIDCCLRTRFAWVRSQTDSVFPNTLALDKYLDQYRAACRDLPTEMREDFENQQARLYDHLLAVSSQLRVRLPGGRSRPYTKQEALDDVLLDSQVILSPLFRHCLAKANDLGWTAKRFARDAYQQYLLAPRLYREIWKNWIPQGLIEAVHKKTRGFHD